MCGIRSQGGDFLYSRLAFLLIHLLIVEFESLSNNDTVMWILSCKEVVDLNGVLWA